MNVTIRTDDEDERGRRGMKGKEERVEVKSIPLVMIRRYSSCIRLNGSLHM